MVQRAYPQLFWRGAIRTDTHAVLRALARARDGCVTSVRARPDFSVLVLPRARTRERVAVALATATRDGRVRDRGRGVER